MLDTIWLDTTWPKEITLVEHEEDSRILKRNASCPKRFGAPVNHSES